MVPAMHQIEGPVQSCPECFAQMPAGASFCPACGRSQVIAEAHGKVGGLPESLAGALAYFSFLPAIVFLLVQPYRKNVFVRFHALQCLLFTVATILIALLLWLASLALFAIPVLGPLLVVLVTAVAALAAIFAWLVLVIKAFQGTTYKLPLLGEFAEQYAGRI